MERLRKFDGKLLLITLCTIVLSMFLGYTAPQDARAADSIPLTITVNDSSAQAVGSPTVTLSKDGVTEITALSTGTTGQVKFENVSDFVDVSTNKLSAILKIEYTDGTTGSSYAFENKIYEVININDATNQTQTVTLPDYSAATVKAIPNLEYNKSEQALITVTGANFDFEYALKKDGSYENFSATSPKQKDAGTWIYGVKITGTSESFSEIRDVEAEIGKKPVTLKFEDGAPTEKKWFDDPFTLKVKNNSEVPSGTTYTYSSSVAACASVDTDGKVTPVKPGTTEIKATFTDKNYDVTPAALNFTVNKADAGDVDVAFDKNPLEQVYNASGTFSQNAKVTLASDSTKDVTDKATISYSIESSGNTAGATVSDPANSQVTYKKIGEATVKASLQNNNWFDFTAGSEPSKTYKATITGVAPPTAPYTIEGSKINDNTVADYDCFKDSFIIKPATGYQIAAYDSGKNLKDQDFKNELSYTEAASKLYDKETIQYVLKDKNTGSITDIQKVKEAIGIDQTVPTINRFDITTEGDLLYNLTFGLFGKSRIKVTVTAADDSPSGGIADIKLYGPEEGKEITTKEALSNKFEGYKSTATKVFYIDPKDHQDNFGGYLWTVATDKADHSSGKTKADGNNSWVDTEQLKHGEGYFNIETIKPVYQNISYVQNTDVSGDKTGDIQDNGTYTTGANTKINFDLKDSDSGLKDFTIKVNGADLSAKNVEVEKNADNITYPSNYNTVEKSLQEIYKYTIKTENGNFYKSNDSDVITIGVDGSYAIELKATDHAGNESIQNFTLKQDKTTAAITEFAFKPTTIPEGEGNGSPVDAAKNEYGFFVNETTEVTITAKDTASLNETASGVKTITYKAVGDANIPETTAAVDNGGKVRFNVPPNFKGQIYACATDNMGQSTVLYKNKADTNPLHLPNDFTDGQFDEDGFCHPLGLIVENIDQHKSLSSIGINDPNKNDGYINEKLTDNPFEAQGIEDDKDLFDYKNSELKVYNGLSDLNFQLSVSDTYSGIKQIETKVFDGSLANPVTTYYDMTTVDSDGNVNAESKWSDKDKESNLLVKSTKEIPISPLDFNEETVFIQVILTDNAGNQTYNYYPFAIDKTNPTVDSFEVNRKNAGPASKFLNKITFGHFFNETVEVSVTTSDDKPSAGITEAADKKGKIVLKGKTTDDKEVTFDEIKGSFSERKPLSENNYETQATKKFNVSPNFKGSIYAVVTDNAGLSSEPEESYLSKGMIVEDSVRHYEEATIGIADPNDNKAYVRAVMESNPFEGKGIDGDKKLFAYEKSELRVYNGLSKLDFQLSVSDPYSGIKQIETKVFDGNPDAPVDVYHDMTTVDSNGNVNAGSTWSANEEDKESNLLISSTKTIQLNPSDFKKETVLIQVILTDNAGNQSYNYYPFAIDKTNPTVDKFEIEHIHDKPIDKILNNLTFGLFFNEELRVTVITSDNGPSGGISDSGNIAVWGKTADDKDILVDPVDRGFNETKPSKANGYTTTATKKYILPLEFDGCLYAQVQDNAQKSSPTTQAVGPGEHGEPANTTVDGKALADLQGYINLEAHVPNIFKTAAENEASLVNDKEPNGQFKNDQVKQINGVHKGETFTHIDGRDYITGDAELSFVVQDVNSGLNKVTIEVNEKEVSAAAVTINNGEKAYLFDYVQHSTSTDKPFREKDRYVINTTGIAPDENGEYRVKVTVTDNAGNVSTLSRTFYKDITAATVTDFIFTPTEHTEGTNKPINAVETDYGYYFREAADVTITATDNKYPQDREAVSGLASITYVAEDINGNIISGKDEAVDGNGKVKFTIPANFKGQIYAYATDKLGQSADKVVSGAFSDAGLHWPAGYDSDGAGNKIVIQKDGLYPGYVHPSGSIVENSAQHHQTSDIQITAPAPVGSEDHAASYSHTTQMDKEPAYDASQMVPLYNGGFNFNVSVGDSYSGIREITWTVIESGADQSKATVTVENDGNLTGNDSGWSINERDRNLVTRMSTSIPVSGNYNDMVLRVDLTDRSGNQSYDYYMFGIDTTAPTINVSYDNNNGDSIGAKEANHAYYNADRIATITVTERNFDPARVNVHATSNGGAMPVGLSWSDAQAGGNGDGSTHVAQIVYSDDADYAFTMDCMDRANWTNSGIDYGSSLTPENFTVDKTLPVVTVTYDNNDAANGKYFKANRTATITVQEHNFDVSRMTTQITAMLDGQGIGVPVVSWSGGGDTHYGTVAFTTDGDYTLNVTEARDAAGNAFAGPNYSAIAAQDFTVDTKIEKPVIRGVENEHAYKDDFAIGFDILDINFDTDTIQLLRTRYDKKDEDVTADFLTHISRTDKGDVADGNTIEKKQDYDGIYTLNLTVTDKATNTESATVTFSVNRFGSVYVYEPYLSSILDGYVKKVDQGLVITEYNPDRLLQNSLQLQATRDSAPMKDLRYTVSPAISNTATVGESGWYQYRYSINADNFDKDGIYAVTVASKDEAGNQPENTNYPDKDILFRVDSVAPELMSVTGLEKDTINAIKANVEYKAFDAIALDEVSVYVNNERVDYVNTFEDLTTYSGEFSIGEGVRQNIRLVLKDKAGNVLNTADADFKVSFPFERTVTVSTNPFVRWFSNIYRTIGTTAVGVVAIGVCIYLLLKKNKVKDSSDNESTK